MYCGEKPESGAVSSPRRLPAVVLCRERVMEEGKVWPHSRRRCRRSREARKGGGSRCVVMCMEYGRAKAEVGEISLVGLRGWRVEVSIFVNKI